MNSLRAPSRTLRHIPAPGVRLGVRDHLIFSLIERGPVHSGHVATYAGMSKDVAKRRLRRLKDAGYLTVSVTAMEEKNRYLLTNQSALVLARVTGRSIDDIRVPRGLGRTEFAHFDQAADLVIALELAGVKTGRFTVRRALFEGGIRRIIGNPEGAIIPDGIVEIETAEGTVALVVEADRQENPSWFGKYKAGPYGDLVRSGGTVLGSRSFQVLVTVLSLRRLHKLVAAAWEAGIPEGLVLFALAEEVDATNVLTNVWLTPRIVGDETRLVPCRPLDDVAPAPVQRPRVREAE